MPIPTDIEWTSCVYARMPLNDHFQVFTAIDTVKAIMTAHGWIKVGKAFARTTMTYGGVVGSGGAFSKVILDFFGRGIQVYNSLDGQRDPTGDDTGVNGAFFVGVDVAGMDEATRDLEIVAKMNELASPFFIVTLPEDGSNGLLTITEILDDETQRNDLQWTANVLAGYQFNGPTKYGGWQMESSFANGVSTGTAKFWSSPSHNFVVEMTLDLPPRSVTLPPFYFASRQDAWMVINPYMWIFGNLDEPYSPAAVDEVLQGGSDWWFCCPRVVPASMLDLVVGDPLPIEYCGFVSTITRNVLVDKGATIYMNGTLTHVGREEDCGVCLIPLNSMYHSDGALTTQTKVPIEISSILGISQNQTTHIDLRIVGDVWDMYLVSKYYPQNSHFFRPTDGREVFAYRSQQFPCEVSLMCAFNRF